MKNSKRSKSATVLLVLMFLFMPLSLVSAAVSLEFNPDVYETKTFTAGDLTVTCGAYEGLVYVSNPVDSDHQSMNVYVPEGLEADESTPIFFPDNVGGYNPALPGKPGINDHTGGPNAALVALSIGAADARDNIFAASCYCPITNLDNADMAYEWLFNGEHAHTGF